MTALGDVLAAIEARRDRAFAQADRAKHNGNRPVSAMHSDFGAGLHEAAGIVRGFIEAEGDTAAKAEVGT